MASDPREETACLWALFPFAILHHNVDWLIKVNGVYELSYVQYIHCKKVVFLFLQISLVTGLCGRCLCPCG